MEQAILTEQEERQSDVIRTGCAEIDKRIGGGIPLGSMTLIEGQSDAGKSVLAQQLIWGTLSSNKHQVILFTTEDTMRSLNKQMDSLGLSILDHLILGRLKVYSVKASQMESDSAFEAIFTIVRRFPSHAVIVVDSLTPVIAHASAESIITYLEECKRLCDRNRTIINVAHTYAFNEEFLNRVRSVCDAHFRLRIEEVGDKLVKVMEVAKVRGADKTTGNLVSFEVEPGVGMRVMPISKAKA